MPQTAPEWRAPELTLDADLIRERIDGRTRW
jgi:hypothetical protein